MARYDASTAEVLIFTFKEGLLSRLAHDLKLRATRFELDLDEQLNQAALRAEANSLVVVTAMKDGREAPTALPDFARSEIEKNISSNDVLAVKRFGAIIFQSTRITGTEVEGTLTLHGVTKPVRGQRLDTATHFTAKFQIDQRDFGMKPYSAVLGTLRIRSGLTVKISAPITAS